MLNFKLHLNVRVGLDKKNKAMACVGVYFGALSGMAQLDASETGTTTSRKCCFNQGVGVDIRDLYSFDITP